MAMAKLIVKGRGSPNFKSWKDQLGTYFQPSLFGKSYQFFSLVRSLLVYTYRTKHFPQTQKLKVIFKHSRSKLPGIPYQRRYWDDLNDVLLVIWYRILSLCPFITLAPVFLFFKMYPKVSKPVEDRLTGSQLLSLLFWLLFSSRVQFICQQLPVAFLSVSKNHIIIK